MNMCVKFQASFLTKYTPPWEYYWNDSQQRIKKKLIQQMVIHMNFSVQLT